MESETVKARPSKPMLAIAAFGLAVGLLLVMASCQTQWSWASRTTAGHQKDGLSVSDYPLDEEFVSEMIARRPSSYDYSYTYMLTEGEDSVLVQDVVEMNGLRYELRQVAEPQVDESWERPVKTASILVTKSVPYEDVGNSSKYFPFEMSYSDGGFTGTLARGSLVGLQPEHEVLTRQVDRTINYAGLTSNDASDLPQSRVFDVSSAEGTTEKELALSDVRYEVESLGEDGTPVRYSAVANYRGVEEYLTTPGYAITYAYTGSVEFADTQMVIKATYDATIPWGEALIGIVAFGPVSEIAEALSKGCS